MLFQKSIAPFILSGLVSLSLMSQEKTESIGGAAYQEKYQHPIRKAKGEIKIDGDSQKKVKEKFGEDSLEYQEIKEFDGNNNLKEYMINNALEQKK